MSSTPHNRSLTTWNRWDGWFQHQLTLINAHVSATHHIVHTIHIHSTHNILPCELLSPFLSNSSFSLASPFTSLVQCYRWHRTSDMQFTTSTDLFSPTHFSLSLSLPPISFTLICTSPIQLSPQSQPIGNAPQTGVGWRLTSDLSPRTNPPPSSFLQLSFVAVVSRLLFVGYLNIRRWWKPPVYFLQTATICCSSLIRAPSVCSSTGLLARPLLCSASLEKLHFLFQS